MQRSSRKHFSAFVSPRRDCFILKPNCRLAGEVRMPSGKTARPHITDNKDGTITIKYQPTERGLHEMDIKYEGNHIPGGTTCFATVRSRTTFLWVSFFVNVLFFPPTNRKSSAVLCGCCEQRSGDSVRSWPELWHGQQAGCLHCGHQKCRRRCLIIFLVVSVVVLLLLLLLYDLHLQKKDCQIMLFSSILRRPVAGCGRSLQGRDHLQGQQGWNLHCVLPAHGSRRL